MMTISRINDPNLAKTLKIVGDLHINSNLSEDFETRRLTSFADIINKMSSGGTLIFAGDVFDRNSPSLIDIKLFYTMVYSLSLKNTIYITNGNHDSTTFNFLPEVGFKYINEPSIINDLVMIVPWTYLRELEDHLQATKYKDKLLISHARCTIPPHITEEISIRLLSESFREVVLGDIHTQPTLPFDNVTYTTSPSNVSFTAYKKDSHGYISFNLDEFKPYFSILNIPTKVLLTPKTFKDAERELKGKGSANQYRKLRFSGTAEELRALFKYRPRNMVKDLSLSLDEISTDIPEESKKLSEFLSSKVSLSTFAFNYFKDVLKINSEVIEEIRQGYEAVRSKKGSHR